MECFQRIFYRNYFRKTLRRRFLTGFLMRPMLSTFPGGIKMEHLGLKWVNVSNTSLSPSTIDEHSFLMNIHLSRVLRRSFGIIHLLCMQNFPNNKASVIISKRLCKIAEYCNTWLFVDYLKSRAKIKLLPKF